MGSPVGAAYYISFLQGAASLKRLGTTELYSDIMSVTNRRVIK